MSEAIIVALITGSLSLAGVVISNLATARKNATALHTHQAVTDTKSIIANSNAMIFFTFLTSFQKGCCSLKFCRILSYYSRF